MNNEETASESTAVVRERRDSLMDIVEVNKKRKARAQRSSLSKYGKLIYLLII